MAAPPEVLETALVDVFWSERGVTLRLANGLDVDLAEAFIATGYGRAVWATSAHGWELCLSTGGWSECEAAWCAFERALADSPAGLARDLWWTAWQAGGHYTFTGRPAHDPRALATAESPCAAGSGGV